MKTGTHLRNIMLITVSFIFATLLIYYTRSLHVFGYFYLIPVVIAALAYDYLGVGIVGAVGAIEIAFWVYYFELHKASSSISLGGHSNLGELLVGPTIFLGTCLVLAWLSRKQKEHQKLLEKTSTHDRLTGLYNYGYFIDRLEEEVKRAGRYGLETSLIMLDLDKFKAFNDAFGHEKGNVMLIRISQIIGQNIREVDIPARYGGEEFALVLPYTGTEETQVIAERIRKSVEKTDFKGDGPQAVVKMTLSLGVATFPVTAKSITDLIFQADEALYDAKRKGRNRVCVYTSLNPIEKVST